MIIIMRVPLQVKLLVLVVLGVFVPLELSVLYVLHSKRQELDRAFLRQGRMMADQVVIVRRWLSKMGGVYVRKQPYFQDEERYLEGVDTATIDGDPLTLRSPFLVTRELSALSSAEGLSRFRIVSLSPINPRNRPDSWEEAVLQSFDRGIQESWAVTAKGREARYRYMAPLFSEASCYRCHVESAYPLGGVRGGISVDFPIGDIMAQAAASTRIYALISAALGLLIIGLLWMATRRFLLQPLAEVNAALSALARGDYQRELVPRGRDELGDLAGTVIKVRSIIREQTAALLEQEKLASLGEISAGLAHEIRNPLSAILSGIALLESDKRTPAERERITALIRREAGRLNNSLTDFLLFARPREPKKIRIDLSRLVREIVQMIEDDVELKGEVELRLSLEEMPAIWFDDDQLRQLIWNVVLNSLQALKGRGQLIIQTQRQEGGGWRLVVQDNGPGIPPEIADRIYEPFFSTKKDGTGLGLSIVKRIIAAHHGAIVHETPPEGGCRFTITAPGEGPSPPGSGGRAIVIS
jgi:signal transduction histidine kinase